MTKNLGKLQFARKKYLQVSVSILNLGWGLASKKHNLTYFVEISVLCFERNLKIVLW